MSYSTFNLPGSSYEEIQKVIKGYLHAPESSSLGELAKLTGIHSTIISRNSKFLTDTNIISGGNKKSITDLGKKLGRAIEHGHKEDIRKYWKEAISSNEKLSSLISTVRIRVKMTEKEFIEHVLYVSGQSKNSNNKTGAKCVTDLLLDVELLENSDESLIVKKTNDTYEREIEKQVNDAVAPIEKTNLKESTNSSIAVNTQPSISINIQLHLPESENADVYEKLFKALREQLISPSNEK